MFTIRWPFRMRLSSEGPARKSKRVGKCIPYAAVLEPIKWLLKPFRGILV